MKKGLLGTLFGLALATLGTSITAPAYALVLGANSGNITFSVDTVGANSQVVKFDDFNLTYPQKLLSPGGGFPLLGASTQVSLDPGPALIVSPGLNLVLGLTGDFGGGNTRLRAFDDVNPLPGFSAGIVWESGSVSDYPNVPPSPRTASVNVSKGSGTFKNNSFDTLSLIGGGWLSVFGNVGVPDGYVAASLAGTIGGIAIDPIIIASDGVGPRNDFIKSGTWQSQPINGQAQFRAAGVSLIPVLISMAPGEEISIEGTLTLIADPDSGLELAPLPPGAPLPNLGPSGGTVIPTPAVLPGLISMGIAAWRKRRQEEMAGEQEADPVIEEV